MPTTPAPTGEWNSRYGGRRPLAILLTTFSPRGPNDEKAMEHLDIGSAILPDSGRWSSSLINRHHLYKLLLNGELYLAPIGATPQVCFVTFFRGNGEIDKYIILTLSLSVFWMSALELVYGQCVQFFDMFLSSRSWLLTLMCSDFADEHPESIVIGTDLSPIQPEFVPTNLSFEVCDFVTADTFVAQKS